MKGPLDRTKVVIRRLPPTIAESTLMEQIDVKFAGRYNWVCFRPGKNSQKHLSFSRAYINFNKPEDIIEFAEFFDGHVFVNEKGTQFKVVVEYAPSQRAPKQWSKKDGREGTIYKDPEYLEFLEFLSKPVENLPSAEIQLERREAERAGSTKDAPIVTPLMDYIRQKRAAKGVSRRALSNGKLSRRVSGSSAGNSSSASSKRSSEKRRTSTTMYVLRENSKNAGGKDKSNYFLMSRRADRQLSDKPVSSTGTEALEEEIGTGIDDAGKKKFLLLKGKEREVLHASGGTPHQQTPTSPVKTVTKQNQRREGSSSRIIRSILVNKDARQSQSQTPSNVHSEQQNQNLNTEKEKRPARLSNVQLMTKDVMNGAPQDDKVVVGGSEVHGFSSEKQQEKQRTRNKDRPDRGVWTPLRRSDGLHTSDESFSSSASPATVSLSDSFDGGRTEVKLDALNARSGEKTFGSGRSSHIQPSVDNGPNKHLGRRGPTHSAKEVDSSPNIGEGKPPKRGISGYSSHEKQVWVQKSSSGS